MIIAAIREERYYRYTLIPMAKEILDQLAARQGKQRWPESAQQCKIVKIASRALGSEKELEPPLLHPEDSCNLLFWGLFDDLSPLVFRSKIEQEFGVKFTYEESVCFLHEDWTLEKLINFCDQKISPL